MRGFTARNTPYMGLVDRRPVVCRNLAMGFWVPLQAARARGLPGGWPYLLQEVRVCLLEVVEGLEEASLDAGHVLLCEVGIVLGGGVGARPQQRHEAGCHHVRA